MENLVNKNSFWHGKKVFITGHTGFKGGWLVKILKKFGAEIYGFSLAPVGELNFFTLANVGRNIHSVEGDVRSLSNLKAAINEFQPQIIFHLAAQSLVRESYRDPVQTYETNVMGVVNILQAIRDVESVRSVVITTSDKCYENREWTWGYRENEAMGGHDPYSSSKGCAELVVSAFHRSYFNNQRRLGLSSVRAGNVIGGGDWSEDRLIPDIFRALIKNESIQIRNPNAIRPWQHVLEPLCGYILLAEKSFENSEQYNGGWNFGPDFNDTKPVSWIVENIVDKWGLKSDWVQNNEDAPHEADILRLDCSKAKSLLNWSPQLNIDQSLGLTINWYKAFQNNSDMEKISSDQIEKYFYR